MYVDLTTVVASALTAVIVSAFTLIGNRYLSRILDRIEKELNQGAKNNKNGKTEQPK